MAASDVEVDAIALIRAKPVTEAERKFARDSQRLYSGMFEDLEMTELEACKFWLEVRAAFAAAEQQ